MISMPRWIPWLRSHSREKSSNVLPARASSIPSIAFNISLTTGAAFLLIRSEHADRRSFDILPQHRVQTVTSGNIHHNPQLGFQQELDVDQIQQTEFAIALIIDKKIDIALLASFTARSRAKHIKRCRTQCPDGIGTCCQLSHCFCLLHLVKSPP